MYKITVASILYCVLTFNLHEGRKQLVKLSLVSQKAQKPLDLGFYKAYVNDVTMSPLSKIKHKSPINTTSPQLISNICTTSTFDQTLVEPLESQFVLSLDLSND